MASIASAITTGFLAVVAWVQAKQLAYKDLVSHYNDMATKVYPVIGRNLSSMTDPVTMLVGLQGEFVGGGPTAYWWPRLKAEQPGLVHHLPPSLFGRLDALMKKAKACDDNRHGAYAHLWKLFESQCTPSAKTYGAALDMPMIQVSPQYGIEGLAIQVLWARGESVDAWMMRTLPIQYQSKAQMEIHMSGRVIAREDAAKNLIAQTLVEANRDATLLSVAALARDVALEAQTALAEFAQEESRVPSRHWLWPKLATQAA